MPGVSSSSKCVTQTAAGRNKSKAAKLTEQNQTSAAVGFVVAAMLGGFLWWRQKRSGGAGKGAGKGSVTAPTSKARIEAGPAAASNAQPRNRAANNKKNKVRKKAERDRRDSKRKKEAAVGSSSIAKGPSSQPREPDPNNDKLILNYHHWTDTK